MLHFLSACEAECCVLLAFGVKRRDVCCLAAVRRPQRAGGGPGTRARHAPDGGMPAVLASHRQSLRLRRQQHSRTVTMMR